MKVKSKPLLDWYEALNFPCFSLFLSSPSPSLRLLFHTVSLQPSHFDRRFIIALGKMEFSPFINMKQLCFYALKIKKFQVWFGRWKKRKMEQALVDRMPTFHMWAAATMHYSAAPPPLPPRPQHPASTPSFESFHATLCNKAMNF